MGKLIKKIYPTKRVFFFHLLILLFSFFFYSHSLSYSFISDDFFYISFSSFREVLSFQKGFYHYNPVFWTSMFVLKQLFGVNPLPFHFFAILTHLVNILLVYHLARSLTFGVKQSLVASFLFSFFFSHYEVVYWITGINTSLMVFFTLLGLMSFITFSRTREIRWYTLFLLFFILAFLTHEYALSILPVSFIYFLLFPPSHSIKNSIRWFLLPTLIVLGTSLAKLFFAHVSLVVLFPGINRMIISFMKSFLYLFSGNPYLIDGLPKIALIPFFLAAFLFLLFRSFSSKRSIFLFIWMSISIILYSGTSLPQARYFYLSSIPAFLLLIDLLSSSRRFFFLFTFFILVSGIFFLGNQHIYWQKSSYTTQQVLTTLDRFSAQLKGAQKVYFLNLPDSSNTGPWKAYVFRNGLANWITMRYGLNQSNIFFFKTEEATAASRDDPAISQESLARTEKEGNLIFRFNSVQDDIELSGMALFFQR